MRKAIPLFLFCLSLVNPVFAESPKKVLRLNDLEPGTEAIGFSVFKGIEPEPFRVTLGDLVDNLGNKLILARISGKTSMDTPLERIGAISGMSGSPIFIGCDDLDDCVKNGTLVGALSYSIGAFIEGGMNVLLTPAEYMLGARIGGYLAAKTLSNRTNTLSVDGVEFKDLLQFSGIKGLASAIEVSSKCGGDTKSVLKPGSMVSVYLAKGTLPLAASGTVTWVDGNNIYIFGHPFFGTGAVAYPFSHIAVADTLQTPFGAYKMAGCALEASGTMLIDGAYEMAGVIGRETRLVSLELELGLGEGSATFSEEIAPGPMARIIIGAVPGMWAGQLLGDMNGLSIVYQARIVLVDKPEIFFTNIVPAEAGANSLSGLLKNIDGVFQELSDSGFGYRVENIRIKAELIKGFRLWRKKAAFLSKRYAIPGETVNINVVLEEFPAGQVRQITIPVRIPDDFMERLWADDPSQIVVMVQSANKFKNLSLRTSNPGSIEEVISRLENKLNLSADTLYIQTITYRPKAEQDAEAKSLVALSRKPMSWIELGPSEISDLPSDLKMKYELRVAPPLENYIDMDASFVIMVNKKPSSVPDKERRSKKWYFLFLR